MWGCSKALDYTEELRPPGWVPLGMEMSLQEHPLYPKDPAVTRAIHEFDPQMVPMLCRYIFLSPAVEGSNRSVQVFQYHAMGHVERTPRAKPLQWSMEPGVSCGPLPNVIDRIWDDGPGGPREWFRDPDLPGGFVRWDWDLYYRARKEFCGRNFEGSSMEKLEKEREERKAAKAWSDSEFHGAMDEFNVWAAKKMEEASTPETLETMRELEYKRRQFRLPAPLRFGIRM